MGGHRMYYAVVRIPEVRVLLDRPRGNNRGLGFAVPSDWAEISELYMSGHQLDSLEASWLPGEDAGRWALHEPVRSLFLCLPSRFQGAPRRLVARVAFDVAEKTVPVFLRPSALVRPSLYHAEPFDGIKQRVQASMRKFNKTEVFDSSRMEERQSILCVSSACDTLWILASSNSLQISRHAKVVVDVGCNKRSFALDWLDADSGDDRWVIALEPDPDTASQHPEHPHLALLQAAVGRVDAGKPTNVTLYRGANSLCSSLYPFQVEPWMAKELNPIALSCYTPSGQVEVPMIPLSLVLSALPGDMEIWMLKVDAQGHELDVIQSARSEIHRVRQIAMEISDIRSMVFGNQNHPRSAPSYEKVLPVLTKFGFVLDSCKIFNYVTNGHNCNFVRADLVGKHSDALDNYNEAFRL